MELVTAYNKVNQIERIHYITMESLVNEISEKYKGQIISEMNQWRIKDDLKEHMIGRGLNRYFQVEMWLNKNRVQMNVHEVNKYDRPKECVVWN